MNLKKILINLNQRPVSFYPIYRQLTGSLTAGVLLSQLMYWWTKVGGREFYKTDAEIINETKLTSNELRGAKKRLKKCTFIKIERKGLPAKTYYKINHDALLFQIGEINETDESDQTSLVNSTSQIGEINKTVIVNSKQQDELSPHVISSEINGTTSENTHKTTHKTTTENTTMQNFSLENEKEIERLKAELKNEKEKNCAKKEKSTEWGKAKDVLIYLNEATGATYQINANVARPIHDKVKQGYAVQDMKNVIDLKVKQWTGKKYEANLTIKTLFGSKFYDYEQEAKRISKNPKILENEQQKNGHQFDPKKAAVREQIFGKVF